MATKKPKRSQPKKPNRPKAATAAPAKPKPKPKAPPAKPNPKPSTAPVKGKGLRVMRYGAPAHNVDDKRKEGQYQYVRAYVEGLDGDQLRWEFKLNSANLPGSLRHDEDITGWSRDEIIKVTKLMLDIEADDPVDVQVIIG